MNKPNIYDGVVTRPMTDEEYTQWQIDASDAEESAQIEAERIAAKNAAREALLERLGITAEEAQLLLGA